MSDSIILVARSWQIDSIGQRISVEEQKEVMCEIRSISRSEWSAAASAGFNPAFEATVSTVEYHGEAICIWNGERYAVYRTYRNFEMDEVELYFEKQVGVTNDR